MKNFKSPIPKKLIEKAKMDWKNNPPKVKTKDKTKEFFINTLIESWWKKKGHKDVLAYTVNEFLKQK